MRQAQCVEFLRWALPRLGLAWPGFRRVHRQVCRRLARRLAELRLADFAAYLAYIAEHDTEWPEIDASCRITISRFYRDADVFDHLVQHVLPALATDARQRGARCLRAWSAGCGAGEEPYSVKLGWDLGVAANFPGLGLSVIGTDTDEPQARARDGCYRAGTLRELPAAWIETAFAPSGSLRCLGPRHREGVEFVRQDLRDGAPPGQFDLVLCRNLAFTYFGGELRGHVLAILVRALLPGGMLVLGRREQGPVSAELEPWMPELRIYRKRVIALPPAGAGERPIR